MPSFSEFVLDLRLSLVSQYSLAMLLAGRDRILLASMLIGGNYTVFSCWFLAFGFALEMRVEEIVVCQSGSAFAVQFTSVLG